MDYWEGYCYLSLSGEEKLRIYAISDIHIDFAENLRWLNNLSFFDYLNDVLILAGDVTHIISLFEKTIRDLRKRFFEVLFIPGNHDLWVRHSNAMIRDSFEKLELIKTIASDCGIKMEPVHLSSVSIIPLFAWYDFSFAKPDPEISKLWIDYIACKWPERCNEESLTQYFIAQNKFNTELNPNQFVISFSHFLPRIDIMPIYIPAEKRSLYPMLGTVLLEKQIRHLGSNIHVYGHSHINNSVAKDNTLYINNAFGYPYETLITAKKLKCIFEM